MKPGASYQVPCTAGSHANVGVSPPGCQQPGMNWLTFSGEAVTGYAADPGLTGIYLKQFQAILMWTVLCCTSWEGNFYPSFSQVP